MSWLDEIITYVTSGIRVSFRKQVEFLLIKNCFWNYTYMIKLIQCLKYHFDDEFTIGMLYELDRIKYTRREYMIVFNQLDKSIWQQVNIGKPFAVVIMRKDDYHAIPLRYRKTLKDVVRNKDFPEDLNDINIVTFYPPMFKNTIETPLNQLSRELLIEFNNIIQVAKAMYISLKTHDHP